MLLIAQVLFDEILYPTIPVQSKKAISTHNKKHFSRVMHTMATLDTECYWIMGMCLIFSDKLRIRVLIEPTTLYLIIF